MIHVIGSPVSPYVRNALAILALKNVEFDIDPVVELLLLVDGSPRCGPMTAA